jgi:divalent metal cation (Fe/Co/Zn/Cd) transporter
MVEKATGLKTIWFFVGIVLLMMGILVFISGIINLINPPPKQPVLSELHPALWWGGMMVVMGLIYLISNKNKVVE